MKVYNTNRKVLKRFTIIEVIVSCIVVLTTLVGHNGILHSKLMTFAVYQNNTAYTYWRVVNTNNYLVRIYSILFKN